VLTVVVLGTACWFVSALTFKPQETEAGLRPRLENLPRAAVPSLKSVAQTLRAAASWLWPLLRRAGIATARALRGTAIAVARAIRVGALAVGRTARATGLAALQSWDGTKQDLRELARRRRERRSRTGHVTRQRRVDFDQSLILTAPEDDPGGVLLPATSFPSRRPSAVSRTVAFVQLMLLVVLWGSAAALAIAGAAWAVARIV
jgi:hypothetical protein